MTHIKELVKNPRFICKLVTLILCLVAITIDHNRVSTLRMTGAGAYLDLIFVLLVVYFWEAPSIYMMMPILALNIICNLLSAILGLSGGSDYGTESCIVPLLIAVCSIVNFVFLFTTKN